MNDVLKDIKYLFKVGLLLTLAYSDDYNNHI